MLIRFDVGWPPKELSPNGRAHWRVKSRKAKKYRSECFVWAHNALTQQGAQIVQGGRLRLSLVFCPPDKRRRDDDNLVAAFKSGRDGIADALGIDDSLFVTQFEIGTPVPGGRVEVSICKKDSE